MANKKYSKYIDQDYEVKTFRWPYWLLPLLFISLLLVLGLFIFITIHSTDSLGCFFNCDRKIDNGGVRAPIMDRVISAENDTRPTKHIREENATEKSTKTSQQKKGTVKAKDEITLFGKILFPQGNIPNVLPANSHLKVDFEDVSIQDASSLNIASTNIDLSKYSKNSELNYEIKCKRPRPLHGIYDLSAVLNMGWKPDDNHWIRKNDYFTDTSINVRITDKVDKYEKDIQLVQYT